MTYLTSIQAPPIMRINSSTWVCRDIARAKELSLMGNNYTPTTHSSDDIGSMIHKS
jgi:hypothetical protein